MHQNSPTAIYILKNFPGEKPSNPRFRGREGEIGERGRWMGEGGERVGKGREGKG